MVGLHTLMYILLCGIGYVMIRESFHAFQREFIYKRRDLLKELNEAEKILAQQRIATASPMVRRLSKSPSMHQMTFEWAFVEGRKEYIENHRIMRKVPWVEVKMMDTSTWKLSSMKKYLEWMKDKIESMRGELLAAELGL